MSGEEIKPGDTVRLKSGGPLMTVQTVGNYDGLGGRGANCVWFEKSKKETAVFALSNLEKE